MRSIFVYTIREIIGACLLGLFFLFVLAWIAYELIADIIRWFRRKR